jgi:HEPN domain-containing protein
MVEHNPVVREWIAKAEADWEAAQILRGINSATQRDTIAYHTQQCVEKLLKANLIDLGQLVRKTHDLSELSVSLERVSESWRWDSDELEQLTDAGVLNRYPGFNTSEEEMLELIAMAHRLRHALLQHLGIAPQAILP